SVIPTMSVSWNASRPIMGRDTCPVIATTGELSMYAAASPVTRLVAPGPDVATHTPTRPLARAYPSAAWAAACSCRTMTSRPRLHQHLPQTVTPRGDRLDGEVQYVHLSPHDLRDRREGGGDRAVADRRRAPLRSIPGTGQPHVGRRGHRAARHLEMREPVDLR